MAKDHDRYITRYVQLQNSDRYFKKSYKIVIVLGWGLFRKIIVMDVFPCVQLLDDLVSITIVNLVAK